jgi:tryptophan synthase alpha subunit
MSAFSGKASSHDKDNVIDAINKSVTDGADIINLSLGFDACIDGCCAICQAVDNAVKAGLNVVAAMGNTHRTVKSPPDCPAQARSAMSVAASTKSDTI